MNCLLKPSQELYGLGTPTSPALVYVVLPFCGRAHCKSMVILLSIECSVQCLGARRLHLGECEGRLQHRDGGRGKFVSLAIGCKSFFFFFNKLCFLGSGETVIFVLLCMLTVTRPSFGEMCI